MRSDRFQRGFVSISGIFSLLVLGAMIFLALRLAPPYFSNYQLQDSIQNLALIASYSPMTEPEILHAVQSRANGYGIQLPPNQIQVHKGRDQVVIVADYSVPIDLLVKHVELHFEPSASNQRITGAGN